MNLELIKSFILAILVGLSLLLTFSLWNYKPDYELYYPQSKYVNEVDLGGIESSKKTVVQPKSIVYHQGEEISGFREAKLGRDLYREIEQWSLDDYQVEAYKDLASYSNFLEIAFPYDIPMEMIKNLFIVDDEVEELPHWSFQKMIITREEDQHLIFVHFLSTDENKQLRFTVHDSEAYDQLMSYITDDDYMMAFTSFGKSQSIYVPAEPLGMNRRSLSIKSIEPNLLVNALFSNPSLVSPNVGEAYFTDGQRGMRLMQEGRMMEFINPIHENNEAEPINMNDLLDMSLSYVNGHKGWTDIYTLKEINIDQGSLKYQMEYEGYPVHSGGGLSTIKQQWLNSDIHQYTRPMFSLNNILGVETVQLPAGKEIISYLLNNQDYEEEDIKDIQIGYRLTYIEGANYSVMLDPTWYMNYKGSWQEINLDEQVEKGGA